MYFIIYKTTNLITSQEYIGCHETDNLDDGYLGSGKYIKRAVKKYGRDNFKREILCFCDSRDDMAQKEASYVTEDYVSRNDTYNLQTGGLSNGILCDDSKRLISESVKKAHANGAYVESSKARCGTRLSDEQKEKISATLKERYATQAHHLIGVEPWNKGEIGVQQAWNKGKKLGPMSEEERKRRSETLKERYATQEHHLKGREAHNKGKKTSKPAWNRGKAAPTDTCIHCGKQASKTNIKRWHNENCKEQK